MCWNQVVRVGGGLTWLRIVSICGLLQPVYHSVSKMDLMEICSEVVRMGENRLRVLCWSLRLCFLSVAQFATSGTLYKHSEYLNTLWENCLALVFEPSYFIMLFIMLDVCYQVPHRLWRGVTLTHILKDAYILHAVNNVSKNGLGP